MTDTELTWVCFISGYSHRECQRVHHSSASSPTWKGDVIPKGHDACGWLKKPEWGNKSFEDQIRGFGARGLLETEGT